MDLGFLGSVAASAGKTAARQAAGAVSGLIGNLAGEPSEAETALLEEEHETAVGVVQNWGDVDDEELADKHKDARDTLVTPQQFNKLAQSLVPSPPGLTTDDLPRRFLARLGSFWLDDSEKQARKYFLSASVGGTETELRVVESRNSRPVPLRAGTAVEEHFSPVVTSSSSGTAVPLRWEGEWRGSYSALSKESLRIRLWEQHWGINKLRGTFEESLSTAVSSSVTRNCQLGTCRLSFAFELQEVFDFPLNFCHCRIRWKIPGETPDGEGMKIRLKVPAGGFNKWPLNAISGYPDELGGEEQSIGWEFVGRLTFRGTTASLEAAAVDVTVTGSETLTGVWPLRGVCSSADGGCELKDPTGKSVAELRGECGVPFKPKFRQCGHMVDVDDRGFYLFVKIVKLEKLDAQTLSDQLSSFVEVEFENESKTTSTVRGSLSPQFQSSLTFRIADNAAPGNPPPVEELLNRPPIRIDVWGESEQERRHIGWTELFLEEFLAESSPGISVAEENKTFYDAQKRQDVTHKVKVYSCIRKLVGLPNPSVSIQVWTKPQITVTSRIKPQTPVRFTIPAEIAGSLEQAISAWNGESFADGRKFDCLALDQRARKLPVDRFVTALAVPSGLSASLNDCFNLVRCFSFTPNSSVPVPSASWRSLDFIVKSRSGAQEHLTALFVSLAKGLDGVKAYLCSGVSRIYGGDPQPHCWALTMDSNGKNVRFWDIAEGSTYHTEGPVSRASMLWEGATARRSMSDAPYLFIDWMTDGDNVYGNLQSGVSPDKLNLDLKNRLLWYHFYRNPISAVANFRISRPPAFEAPESTITLTKKFYDALTESISKKRLALSRMLGTCWSRHPGITQLLERGASLIKDIESWGFEHPQGVAASAELDNWEACLLATCPQSARLQWAPVVLFNPTIKQACQDIWSNVPFLQSTDSLREFIVICRFVCSVVYLSTVVFSLGLHCRSVGSGCRLFYAIVTAVALQPLSVQSNTAPIA